MKYLTLGFLIFVSVFALTQKEFKAIINQCQIQEGASKADVNIVLNWGYPTTPAGKCLWACFLEALGFIDANGLWDSAAFITYVNIQSGGDPQAIAIAQQIDVSCGPIIGSTGSRCDDAVAFMQCAQAILATYGITFAQLLA